DIFRIYGDFLRIVASYGRLRTYTIARDRGVPISRGTVTGRAVIDRQLVHVHDLAAELELSFRSPSPTNKRSAFGRYSPHRCCARVFPLGRSGFTAWRFYRSQISR